MNITILDTTTLKEKTIKTTFSPDWWVVGNGSCDCNRAIEMGCDDELDAKMRKDHPELKEWQGYCYGCNRFLIIACDCSEYSILEYNSEYPDDLIQKHLTL